MLPQGEPVITGNIGLSRELQYHLVGTGAGHDGVDEAREVAGHIADCLASAHDGVLGQVDGRATELRHAGFERHAGAEARLLEEHREGPAPR